MSLPDGGLFALNGPGAVLSGLCEEFDGAARGALNRALAELLSSKAGGHVAGQARQAQFEALALILERNHPRCYIGARDYSAYARFHRLAVEYAAAHSRPMELLATPRISGAAAANQRRVAMDITLAELAAALDTRAIPPSFMQCFAGSPDRPGWFEAFYLYFAWRMKSGEPLRRPLLSCLQAAMGTPGADGRDFSAMLYERAKIFAGHFTRPVVRFAAVGRDMPGGKEIISYVTARLPEDYPPPPGQLPAMHEKKGIPLDVIVLLMQAVKRQNPPRYIIARVLGEKADTYLELVAGLETGGEAALLKAAALVALQEARPDEAELYLQNAAGSGEICLLLGDLQYLQSHFLKAVKYFQTAAGLLPPGDSGQMRRCLRAAARAMFAHERSSGEKEYFDEAVESCKAALELADDEAGRGQTLAILSELGGYLLDFGRRTKAADRLEESIGIFERALALCPRDDDAQQWAELYHQLGTANMVIGNREKSTEHWSEAASCFLEVLKERTREKSPQKWATVQFQLANVLRQAGEQTRDPEMLRQAEAACKNALQERSRGKQPGPWSEAMIWLAKSQSLAGEFDNDMAALGAAIANYGQALEICKPEGRFALWLEARLGQARTNRNIALMTGDDELLQGVRDDLTRLLETARPLAAPWQVSLIENELDRSG